MAKGFIKTAKNFVSKPIVKVGAAVGGVGLLALGALGIVNSKGGFDHSKAAVEVAEEVAETVAEVAEEVIEG